MMVGRHDEGSDGQTASFAVRAPDGDAEITAFFRLAAATFGGAASPAATSEEWRRYVLDGPAADQFHLRGAFRDDDSLGGYLLEERSLQIGAACLPTGCVGAVVVHPDHRRQGIAAALMRDALALARARGLPLLLLNGVADFYTPFGFVDVFDATEHSVDLAAILGRPAPDIDVRSATVADAPALFQLYRRHYGPYAGSFDRLLADQAFRLSFATSTGRPHDAPLLAEDDAGRARGYLTVPWGPLATFGYELAADDWPPLLALLQHEARHLAASPDPRVELRLPLPPDSPTFFLLADHLPVRSRSNHRPRAGWMVSAVDLPGFVRALLPAWQEGWRLASPGWCGDLALTVDDVSWTLRLDRDSVRFADRPFEDESAPRLMLSARRFTQIVFGFRPIAWAAVQDGSAVPAALLPALEALFPPRQTWIAPTDGF